MDPADVEASNPRLKSCSHETNPDADAFAGVASVMRLSRSETRGHFSIG